MKTATRGLPYAAYRENTSIALWTGGHTRLSTTPMPMAANAVTIGTNRLPAKNPRYGGSLIRKYRLNSAPATPPMRMPPKTPVSIESMPMIGFGVRPKYTAMTPSVARSTTKPTVAARAATPSLSVSPSATPIAKMSGSAPKMAPPDCAITFDSVGGSTAKCALPMPSSNPATGRTDTGSISALPIFWRNAKPPASTVISRPR